MNNYEIKVDKEKFELILSNWSKLSFEDKQKVDNIKNEHFMEESSMLKFLNEIMDNEFKMPEICSEILASNSDTLMFKGNYIQRSCPTKIGTVTPLKRLKNFLLHNHAYLESANSDIDDYITSLISGNLVVRDKPIYIKSSTSPIWFTWNEDDCQKDPFSFMKTNVADEIRVALGLGYKEYKNEPLIGLIFDTTEKNLLFRPTFADSYISVYFRPTETNFKKYGKTLFLNNGAFKVGNLSQNIYNINYLPEAIDYAINFNLNTVSKVNIFNSN